MFEILFVTTIDCSKPLASVTAATDMHPVGRTLAGVVVTLIIASRRWLARSIYGTRFVNIRWLLMIFYGLFVIWTGLLRSVEAQTYKPNAFWFCLVTGLIAIAAGYALKAEKQWLGRVLALTAILPVLGFYVCCFIKEAESDATYRVALVIIASIGAFCVVTIPRRAEKAN